MNVGARMAEILRAIDVPVVFGVPGGQTLPLYEATRASGMTHVVMRDERNAACAADAYARVRGTIGVCDATVGPGVTNLVSGLAESLASSVPVLALVADIRTDQEHLRRRSVVSQAVDQGALLASVTKWVGRVERAHALDHVMAQALRVATTGRPGPVVVEVPEDVWTEDATPKLLFDASDACAPRHRSAPVESELARAVDLLARAERPVVLAGGGVLASGAAAALGAFASECAIPVVTTINGKGAIDERSPCSAGVVGLFGSPSALAALDGADVVLVVGSKLDQLSTHRWRLPRADQHTIHVDVDGEEIGRTGTVEVSIVADARVALEEIFEGLRDARRGAQPWFTADGLPLDPAPATPLDPATVTVAVNAMLGPDDVVVCDASYASGWAAAHLRITTPRHFVAPRGLAGIGWSPGAALGAALAGSAGRTVVLAGDGGFAYGLGEIETAARLGCAITYVIFNNSALGWVCHGEDRMGIPRSTFGDVDFAAVARGLGAEAGRATTADELAVQLHRSRSVRGPYLVDVVTSSDTAPTVSLRDVRGSRT